MAYTKKQLEDQALEAINKHGLVFIEDVVCYITCSKSTFYNKSMHELDSIKEALYNNRQAKKIKLRSNWAESENATLQMGLYKLLANENELERLNNSKHKIETDNKHEVQGNINLIFEGQSDLPDSEDNIEVDGFGFED